MKKLSLIILLSLFFIPIVPIVSAGESSRNICYNLWYERNLILAQNKYCFESNLGQQVFKFLECTTNKPVFSLNEKNKINQIIKKEKQLNCEINTSLSISNQSENERKEILDALSIPLQKELKVSVQFVVHELNVLGKYAFIQGVPQQKNGQPINYLKTPYKEHYESGAFDDQFLALLKRSGRNWEVLVYDIGATDLVDACWWKEYNVPKVLFGHGGLEECDYI